MFWYYYDFPQFYAWLDFILTGTKQNRTRVGAALRCNKIYT